MAEKGGTFDEEDIAETEQEVSEEKVEEAPVKVIKRSRRCIAPARQVQELKEAKTEKKEANHSSKAAGKILYSDDGIGEKKSMSEKKNTFEQRLSLSMGNNSKKEIPSTSTSFQVKKRKGFKGLDNYTIYEDEFVVANIKKPKSGKAIGQVKYIDNFKFPNENELTLIVVIEILDSTKWSHFGEIAYGPNDGFLYKSKYDNSACIVKPKDVCKYVPPSFIGEGNCEKIGYLHKQGSKVKNWKHRFFILTMDNLHYFESFESGKEQGRFELAGSSVDDGNECGKPHAFKVHAPGRVLYMNAANDDLKAEWMKAIKEVLETASQRKKNKDLLAEGMKTAKTLMASS